MAATAAKLFATVYLLRIRSLIKEIDNNARDEASTDNCEFNYANIPIIRYNNHRSNNSSPAPTDSHLLISAQPKLKCFFTLSLKRLQRNRQRR